MLKKVRSQNSSADGAHFAIVASKYNEVYVNSMVRAAKSVLVAAKAERVEIFRVPGAFEIPVLVAELTKSESPVYSAVICLGVILRGATTHAQHIGEAVSRALMEIQVRTQVPVIHEVLLLEKREQAVERCLNPKNNRGAEAAYTALEMARVFSELRAEKDRAWKAQYDQFIKRAKRRMEEGKREKDEQS